MLPQTIGITAGPVHGAKRRAMPVNGCSRAVGVVEHRHWPYFS